MSVLYWFFAALRQKKPIEWYEYSQGYTQLDESEYKSSVAYCSLILKNTTRSVVKNVEVLFDNPFEIVACPRGVKFEVLNEDKDYRLIIAAVQPKAELKITANRLGARYVDAHKVFVGDEDMGPSASFKVSKYDAVVLPGWIAVFYLPVLLAVFAALMSLLFSIEDGSASDGVTSESTQEN